MQTSEYIGSQLEYCTDNRLLYKICYNTGKNTAERLQQISNKLKQLELMALTAYFITSSRSQNPNNFQL